MHPMQPSLPPGFSKIQLFAHFWVISRQILVLWLWYPEDDWPRNQGCQSHLAKRGLNFRGTYDPPALGELHHRLSSSCHRVSSDISPQRLEVTIPGWNNLGKSTLPLFEQRKSVFSQPISPWNSYLQPVVHCTTWCVNIILHDRQSGWMYTDKLMLPGYHSWSVLELNGTDSAFLMWIGINGAFATKSPSGTKSVQLKSKCSFIFVNIAVCGDRRTCHRVVDGAQKGVRDGLLDIGLYPWLLLHS